MKNLEHPPKSDLRQLSKSFSLINRDDINTLTTQINEKYYYWDKVKYLKIPKDLTPELLWRFVRWSRNLHSQRVYFGTYSFSYTLTNTIQKQLHLFDLNIGGTLGSGSIIPEEDKKRYLISSIMEEAIASSQIEGAVTTRKQAKEMLRKSRNPRNKSEQMIVNNFITIKHIVDGKDGNLTPEKLLDIHRLITSKTLDNSEDEGRFRETDDVNVVDVLEGEIVYTPPRYQDVPGLINELCDFFNSGSSEPFIHPIVKASIIHFMIGFIHPFVDGNGRTARALFYWYLLSKGYWLTEYLSISRLIIKSKSQYAYAFLYTEIDDNDLTYFINYQLKTMEQSYESLREYIQRKIKEKKQLTEFQKIKGINERQALILKWIYEEPDLLLTVKEIQTRLSVSNQTARTDLTGLAEKRYLQIINVNQKKQSFCKGNSFDKLIKKASFD